MDIQQRLETLERSQRRLRAWAVGMSCVAVGILIMGAGPNDDGEFDQLKVKKLFVSDEVQIADGKNGAIRLRAGDSGTGMSIVDPKGKTRMIIANAIGVPMIVMYDEKEKVRLRAGHFGESGPTLQFYGPPKDRELP